MRNDAVKLAYLAGIIDGEGTLGVYKGKKGHLYKITFRVTNTDFRMIQWLIDNFGGNIDSIVKYKEGDNRKDKYAWKLEGKKGIKLMKRVKSFLVLKAEQANIAINMYEKVTRWNMHPRPAWALHFQEECYQRTLVLNRRGKLDNDVDIVDAELTVVIKNSNKLIIDYK
ncbi:hypothetical protein KAX02_08135 [candidate division WOR-3 bacterium]|nr:hypothetical protein [candidate division WOR-3 bacterium]